MTEKEWRNYICKRLSRVVITPITGVSRPGAYSKRGIADTHMASRLWIGWVEFKGATTRLSNDQHRFLVQQNTVKPWSAVVWRHVPENRDSIQIEYFSSRLERTIWSDVSEVLEILSKLSSAGVSGNS